jgi:hypothetical protein
MTNALHDAERERLRALTSERGTNAAARVLQVAPATLARAVAGLPIARATAHYLRSRLDAAPASESTAAEGT